jgi:hypothetical protein
MFNIDPAPTNALLLRVKCLRIDGAADEIGRHDKRTWTDGSAGERLGVVRLAECMWLRRFCSRMLVIERVGKRGVAADGLRGKEEASRAGDNCRG